MQRLRAGPSGSSAAMFMSTPMRRIGSRCCARAAKRPRRHAAEKRDERAPSHHSITSSARPSSESGVVRPSALAVLRLMISSTLADCWTGRSAIGRLDVLVQAPAAASMLLPKSRPGLRQARANCWKLVVVVPNSRARSGCGVAQGDVDDQRAGCGARSPACARPPADRLSARLHWDWSG